ncbi:UbiD family decarboxylase [Burkholderia sp. Bp8986]|uniref:UbiD family decarboxylase n=1 Tax=Burkholderia sp. Bp8986 TaxID=2184550 RepID=UPI000F5A01F6|nr:UbiD family decarboxylase [Burkholderia sp. Bp8986]RQS43397.1 UbiD family decarboxylase [Burkholderia sp. Bp8986]
MEARRPIHLSSLREYLSALKEIGEVIEIDCEVDWNLEIGAITRRCYETGAPAPLFSHVKGLPGFRVLGAPAGVSARVGQRMARAAISVGLPPSAGALDIVEALSRAEDQLPIPPRRVQIAPCKQNVRIGDDVDLMALPTPLIHGGDGGRYLNTWGTIVARTPDGAWTNWSIARIMLRNRNTLVGIVSSQKHVGKIHAMWRAAGKSMPFALSLGHDPVIPFFSGMPLRDGVSEGPVIGGYLGEAIDVVRCETVDLDVPASSEIVIEGHLSLDEVDEEGPMAEYPGYLIPDSRQMRPIYHVTAMTWRDNAILPIVAAGYPPEENHTCWGIGIAATVLAELRRSGWPVTACFVPFEAACHLLVVTVPVNWREISTYKSANEFARALGEFVFGMRGGTVVPRILIVLDDVDPTDARDVLWAIATRVHPGDGELNFPHLSANPLNAFMKANEKLAMFTTKSVLNGLPSDDWSENDVPMRADFSTLYPDALRQHIRDSWVSGYGFLE